MSHKKINQSILAKVTRPILSNVYLRNRCFGLLDQAILKPVIWVSGPPGCGKTVLVASYLDTRKKKCLWYQLDERDADPATFFYYLGLATKAATPRKQPALPLLTPEYIKGLSTFTLNYFESLNTLLPPPCFFVFDNYQEVDAASVVNGIMRYALSHIPEGSSVVIISRGGVPAELTYLRANNLMAELHWSELQLTLEETREIVQLQTGGTSSNTSAKQLHKATDGWLAGLILTLKKAQRERVDTWLPHMLPDEQIFNYFAGEIFDKIEPDVQDFLLKTAILPTVSVYLAQELTGSPSAERILSQLNRNNYFTLRRLQKTPIYEYHPLFRDFLLSRAQKTLSQETQTNLCRRASELLKKSDQIEAAIELLSDLGDWQEMAALVMKHARNMIAQGRNNILEKWLARFPEDLFKVQPWLCYWRAMSDLFSDPADSAGHFEKAYRGFQDQKDLEGMLLAWSGIIDALFYSWKFAHLDKWFKILEKTIQTIPYFPSKQSECFVASRMFTILSLRKPQHPELQKWEKRAISLAKENHDLENHVLTLSHAVTHALFSGGFPAAAPLLESLEELVAPPNAPPLSRITAKLMSATCHLVKGNLESCLEATSEGLQLSQETGVHFMDITLMGISLACALEIGDLKTADSKFKVIAPLYHHATPFEKAFYHYIKSHYFLALQDLVIAAHHADLASKFAGIAGRDFNLGLCLLRQAIALFRSGDTRMALSLNEKVLDLAKRTQYRLLECKALFIGAYFFLDQGDDNSGLTLLEQSLVLARYLQYHFSDEDIPTMTPKLCARALEAEIETEYVQEIVQNRRLVLREPPIHLGGWPWAIQIFTLGHFELLIDGKVYQSSQKRQSKPLEMLKALLSFGANRTVTKYTLCDILWPDADGDRAQQAFDTTLYRLRQIVRNEKVLDLRHGKLSVEMRYCWVDSFAFEHMLDEAEKVSTDGEKVESIRLLENAVDLYRGPFLEEEDASNWSITYRERLRNRFLHSVAKLVHHYEGRGEADNAVKLLHKAIEVDIFSEVLYQQLMRSLKKQGRLTEALAVYDRCKRILTSRKDYKLSPEMDAMYNCLINNHRP